MEGTLSADPVDGKDADLWGTNLAPPSARYTPAIGRDFPAVSAN
jgi:hypothetical protein